MNLGLTGPLNPLQPGNAALGAQPPRPRAAVNGGGRVGGLLLGRPGRRAGVAGAGSSRPARPSPPPPPPSLLAFLPHPSPAARAPAFVLSSLGLRAWPGSCSAGSEGCAVGPGGPSGPGASRLRGSA